MRLNALPLLAALARMTPDELAAWCAQYDAVSAALRKKYPTPAAEARLRAQQLIAHVARRT